jgi:hypothetical protein
MVGWFGSACARSGGGEGQDGTPRLAARVSRRDPARVARDPRPFAGLNLKNEGKRARPGASALVSFQASRERARSRAAGGEPRRARRAKKKRTIAAIAGRARAGSAATYLLLLLLHVLLRAELVRLRGMGERRAQRDGTAIKTGLRGGRCGRRARSYARAMRDRRGRVACRGSAIVARAR